MNIKEISSKKLFKEYEVEIPYDEVDSLVNIKIAEIIPTVTLPGFRKGKAPTNIVKKNFEAKHDHSFFTIFTMSFAIIWILKMKIYYRNILTY